MKTVSKILFNTLALHRSVTLPGVGSLHAEVAQAELQTKRKLQSPGVRIKFSAQEDRHIDSLVDLIAENGGLDAVRADEVYKGWLSEVQHGDNLFIEGVGEIKSGFFHPSGELSLLLNPAGGEPGSIIPMKIRLEPGRFLVIVLTVIMISAVGGFWLWNFYLRDLESVRKKRAAYAIPGSQGNDQFRADPVEIIDMRPDSVIDPVTGLLVSRASLEMMDTTTGISDARRAAMTGLEAVEAATQEAIRKAKLEEAMERGIAADSEMTEEQRREEAKKQQAEKLAAEKQAADKAAADKKAADEKAAAEKKAAADKAAADKKAADEKAAAQKAAATNATKPATTPATATATAAGPLYHLIVGVFSTEENADKCIAQTKAKVSGLAPSKFKMGAKFGVSAFSSASQAEVNKKKDELKGQMPDLWIYKGK